MRKPTFLEFFCGGGMARCGLGAAWRCVFANDIDVKKGRAYVENWGAGELRITDIHALGAKDIAGAADLAWASFPCQDLSLAGNGAGLKGARSGAFWGFANVIDALRGEGRAPKILVLENVVGALTSNGGADFHELCRALQALGYIFGALMVDAALFLPQSRPRLFVVAVRKDISIASHLIAKMPAPEWRSVALNRAQSTLDMDVQRDWRWWSLPQALRVNTRLLDVIEDNPPDAPWHGNEETQRLLGMMSDANLAKLICARESGKRVAGALYRRTRVDANGAKVQRAEVRFDGLAGCLRTPGGGSSRQFIMLVEGKSVRTRLLSGREAARLMGLPDDYILPTRYNEAYHLLGDGVASPVVRFLSEHLLTPLCTQQSSPLQTAAE